jgi:hypothetical protein
LQDRRAVLGIARWLRTSQAGEPCLQVFAERQEQTTLLGVGGDPQLVLGILKERFEQALLKFWFRGSSDSIGKCKTPRV